MAYQGYKVKDFLYDGSFRKWVLESNPEAAAFWESWLKDNPRKAAELQKAREILLLINFKEHHPESSDQEEVWKKIEATIKEDGHIIPMPVPAGANALPRELLKRKKWYRYAAVFAGFLFAGLLSSYLYNKLPVRYSTGYGEVKTIVLPDNSVVKLNANSSLSYPRGWNWDKKREVRLEGEAFFTVVHKSNNQRFLVYTDDVTVQVLGTEFNVNSRHIGTSVVLNNGSVKLHLNPPASGPDNEESPGDLLMHPGDMVSWSSSTGQLLTEKVDPELHSSWRTNVLIFDDAPITEVARSLEDNFGLDIRFEGEKISMGTFSGSIPMDNVDVFFKTLSRSLDVTIVEKEGTIYILEKDEATKELKPN